MWAASGRKGMILTPFLSNTAQLQQLDGFEHVVLATLKSEFGNVTPKRPRIQVTTLALTV